MIRPALHNLDGSGATDGNVPVWNATTKKWTPAAPATAGVAHVTSGDARIRIDNTDPANPVVTLAADLYVLTSVLGTEPVLVWDGDNQLVYTEVPLP